MPLLSRRELFSAAAAASLASGRLAGSPPHSAVAFRAQAFPLTQVRLLDSPFLDAMQANHGYLLGLDPDRLLHTFRLTAGLPSAAQPLGGWEKPDVELRGHFTGHFLSACALMSAAGNDPVPAARGSYVVNALAGCQKAHANGYLSAFPDSFFDRLRNGEKVWAPFYTLHKILAGLLDQYTLCGNAQALEVATGMAGWVQRFTAPLTDAQMAGIEKVEFGGMNEVLYNLFAITGDPAHAALAHRFDQPAFLDPLAAGQDRLTGLHVNTNIPKVIGAARRYELTGEPRYRDIALFFWRQVALHRSYVTGGTSNGELWRSQPDHLASQLGPTTQECCCTYNMLKLTRHLYAWTADSSYADYYERALMNGIAGTMNPRDGLTMYYVPLEAGYWKIFAEPLDSFWCCTGTGAESFSKLAGAIYDHDDAGLWVNLFIPSRLEWPGKGLVLRQLTRFPQEESTMIEFDRTPSAPVPLRIRVPAWAAGPVAARLNGKPLAASSQPGSYLVLNQTWRAGDRLEIRLPMSLHSAAMPDDPSTQAYLYGPLVLAGDLGTGDVPAALRRGEATFSPAAQRASYRATAPVLVPPSRDPASWIRRSGSSLAFRTSGQERDITLVPLNEIVDQRYAVYWKTRGS